MEQNDDQLALVPLQRPNGRRPLPPAPKNIPLSTPRDHHKAAAKIIRQVISGQIDHDVGAKIVWMLSTAQKMQAGSELEAQMNRIEEMVRGLLR